MKKIQAWKEKKFKHEVRVVYTYFQFQSMDGRNKFIKELKINKCQRCVIICRG